VADCDALLIRAAGYRVIYIDATHFSSTTGRGGGFHFGAIGVLCDRGLARAAMAMGCDGHLLLEVHENRRVRCRMGRIRFAKGFAEAFAHVNGYSCSVS